MKRIYAVTNTPIFLGYTGEHEAREIAFDVGEWKSLHGGVIQLMAARPGEDKKYPVHLTEDGNYVVWTVRDADVALAGQTGVCELSCVAADGAAIKEERWATYVYKALCAEDSDPPAPERAWLDEFRRQVAVSEDVAKRAEQSAVEANMAVSQAGIRAENARNSADAAQRAAGEAGKYSTIAVDAGRAVQQQSADAIKRMEELKSQVGSAAEDVEKDAETASRAAARAEDAATNPPRMSDAGTWLVWDAEAGDYVDTGVSAKGPKGDSGFSPSIDTQTTSTGHTVIVTDASGTKLFEVRDGKDGKDGAAGKDGTNGKNGADGKDGVSPVVDVQGHDLGHLVNITDENKTHSFIVRDGANGKDGAAGTTFTPHVNELGFLSWTNDGGMDNPEPFELGAGNLGAVTGPFWYMDMGGEASSGEMVLLSELRCGSVKASMDTVKIGDPVVSAVDGHLLYVSDVQEGSSLLGTEEPVALLGPTYGHIGNIPGFRTVTIGNSASKADFRCDGVDDQVQIIAALETLSEEGGVIKFVSNGTYNLTGSITPKGTDGKNKHFKNVAICAPAGYNVNLVRGYAPSSGIWDSMLNLLNADNLTVRGITFTSDRATYAANDPTAIDYEGIGESIVVEDCTFSGHVYAINGQTNSNYCRLMVRNCRFTDCTTAIEMYYGEVSGSRFEDNDTAIWVGRYGKKVVLRDNVLGDNGVGIYNYGTDTVVTNNTVWRGSGGAGNFATEQHTIQLASAGLNALIAGNRLLGKDVAPSTYLTGNTVIGNTVTT